MFAKPFSNREYEKKFWPFLFRFETTAIGFVDAAKNYLNDATDAEIRAFLEKCVAKCFDVDGGVVPPGWWDGAELPSIEWFNAYFEVEVPFLVADVKRRVAEKNAARTADAVQAANAASDAKSASDDPVDRAKIRRLAHEDDAFRDYLLRSNGGAERID